MNGKETIPTALVTGATGGFGLLTALRLAGAGYRVAAGYRGADKREALSEQARAAGVEGNMIPVELDVTDEASVSRAVAFAVERLGGIGLLVNNAGIAVGGYVEDLPLEEWRKQMDTNLIGLVSVTRSVLPHMRRQGRGMIINVSSISGRTGFPGFGPYSASKFAVEGLSEALRMEMLPYGVKVVLVEPGSYKTDIWQRGLDRLLAHGENSPYAGRLGKLLAYTRRTAEQAGDPAEVAELIARIARLRNPKLRYPIGRGIKLTLAAKAWLPWRWYERIISRALDKY
jgi:NAD(P)-dependent dehydrogenase (short-subunit alcohol dehydrogenase family)